MLNATVGNVSSQAETRSPRLDALGVRLPSSLRCHRGMRQEAPKDAEPGSDAPRHFGRRKELESWLNSPGDPNWMGSADLEIIPSLVPRGQSIPDFRAAFEKQGAWAASSTWSTGTTPPPHKPWAFPARLAGWGSTHRWSPLQRGWMLDPNRLQVTGASRFHLPSLGARLGSLESRSTEMPTF